MFFYRSTALAERLADELPMLTKVLGGFFHEDAFIFPAEDGHERTGDEGDLFDLVRSLCDAEECKQIALQVEALSLMDDDAVVSFWNHHAHCHGYNLEDATDARAF